MGQEQQPGTRPQQVLDGGPISKTRGVIKKGWPTYSKLNLHKHMGQTENKNSMDN